MRCPIKSGMTSSRRLHDCHVIAGLTGNQLPLHAAHIADIQLLKCCALAIRYKIFVIR